MFEVFKFKSMLVVPAAELSIRADSDARPSLPTSRAQAGVVVDAGFSFTTIVPVFDGKVINPHSCIQHHLGKATLNCAQEHCMPIPVLQLLY